MIHQVALYQPDETLSREVRLEQGPIRHIAMGRRNWLHCGSHDGARNIAFMYSLLESCKLNGLDFGDYIEDVMTRLAEGDTDHASMIACNYKPRQAEAIAKTA